MQSLKILSNKYVYFNCCIDYHVIRCNVQTHNVHIMTKKIKKIINKNI